MLVGWLLGLRAIKEMKDTAECANLKGRNGARAKILDHRDN
jgi:hypothetical protein